MGRLFGTDGVRGIANRDLSTQRAAEIGRALAVTRERVRQIETNALRKLRHPSRLRLLAEYAPQSA